MRQRNKTSYKKRFAFTLGKIALNLGGNRELKKFVRLIFLRRQKGQINGKIIFIGRTVSVLKPLFDSVCQEHGQRFESAVLDFPRDFFKKNDKQDLVKYLRRKLPADKEVTIIDDGGKGNFLPMLLDLFEEAGFKTHVYALGFSRRSDIPNYAGETRGIKPQLARLSLANSGHPYRLEPKLQNGNAVREPTDRIEKNSHDYLKRKLGEK